MHDFSKPSDVDTKKPNSSTSSMFVPICTSTFILSSVFSSCLKKKTFCFAALKLLAKKLINK
jgi:hypothetical protein